MTQITSAYLREMTLSQANQEHLTFTKEDLAEFWHEGELGVEIRAGRITKTEARQLLSEVWNTLPVRIKDQD